MMNAKEHKYDVFEEGTSPDVLDNLKRIFVVVNPKSGGKKGLKILDLVKPILEKGGCEVTVKYTEYAGHAKEIAMKEDLSEFDVFSPIGGDGTVHECVNGFMNRADYDEISQRITIGIIPGGTGNTLAYDMKIISPKRAAEMIIMGSTRRVDVGKCEDISEDEKHDPVYSINIIGYGLPSTVLKVANKLRFIGGAQYKLAAYHSLLKNKSYKCTVEMVDKDGEKKVVDGKYFMIQAQITVHMGERMPFCPQAKLDDGLFDLVLIKHARAMKMVSVMKAAEKEKHLEKPLVDSFQVKEFTITPDPKVKLQGPCTVNIDGELVGMAPLRCSVVPKALRFVSA